MATGLRRYKAERQEGNLTGHKPSRNRRQTLTLRNRQCLRRVDVRVLRQIVQALLQQTGCDADFDLAFYCVAAPEMTRLNETFLQHKGATDVITFDYGEEAGRSSRSCLPGTTAMRAKCRRDACPALLHGEIFICLDEAVFQSRQFHTTWQSELVRYAVHGVLHLLGYDDRDRQGRRKMKEAEDALVDLLARQFDFCDLSRQRAGKRT